MTLNRESESGDSFGYNQVNLNNAYQTPLSGSYSYAYDGSLTPTKRANENNYVDILFFII